MIQVKSLAEINARVAGLQGRNLAVNGGFTVWQRGATQAVAGMFFAADMWQGGSSTFEGSRALSATSVSGQSLRATDNASANKTIKHAIELKTTGLPCQFPIGTKVAVSFIVKSSVAGSTISFGLSFRDGFEGSNVGLDTPVYGSDQAMADADTWYAVSGVTTITMAPNGSNTALLVAITGNNADTNATFDFADVQVELASEPTKFEDVHPADEWARCQRYCQVLQSYTAFTGHISSSTDIHVAIPLTSMMAESPQIEGGAPDFTLYRANNSAQAVSFGSLTAQGSGMKFILTSSGLTSNIPCAVRMNLPTSYIVAGIGVI
ncbi:hypothetical protein DRQ25_10030 [Candidatus Fermentibacteria bacterium]|nr:MAG: hypothetical protein DRQ25_10030 [Candidatus Fermentibacteria bacterium]